MIHILKVKDPYQKWEILKEFNPEEECFIVSDIKTKSSVEDYLLTQNQYLKNNSV